MADGETMQSSLFFLSLNINSGETGVGNTQLVLESGTQHLKQAQVGRCKVHGVLAGVTMICCFDVFINDAFPVEMTFSPSETEAFLEANT